MSWLRHDRRVDQSRSGSLDTGAAATTLTPEAIERIGYSRRDGFKKAKVHTAIGEEKGYWLRVAEFSVLGVTTPNFALTVFPLGHGIDGLVASTHR